MELQKPTDKVVKATLVSLVRKVAWGPSRDALIAKSRSLREQADLEQERGRGELSARLANSLEHRDGQAAILASRAKARELSWHSELYALAAAARFPRDDDPTLRNFVVNIIEDIRRLRDDRFPMPGIQTDDVFAAVSDALRTEGLELQDLPLPPSIDEMIDQGMPRPDYISEKEWDAAVEAYFHQMTLDNTPREFIYGDADEDDYDDGFDPEAEYAMELEQEWWRDQTKAVRLLTGEPAPGDHGYFERTGENEVTFKVYDGDFDTAFRLENGIVHWSHSDGAKSGAFIVDEIYSEFSAAEVAEGKHREFETTSPSNPAMH